MNLELAQLPSPIVREPRIGTATRTSASPDRRRQPRRLADRQQASLAALALWFASRSPHAIFVINEKMRVLLANEAAQDMLRTTKAISVNNGRLEIKSERQRSEVERIISGKAEATSFSLRRSGIHNSVSVTRIWPDIGFGTFILLRVHCRHSVGTHLQLAQKQFGLTRAEADIALAIFNGSSLVEIANERQASLNTIKTQVRHTFQKCGVHSQAQLTRCLAELFTGELN